MVGCDEGEVGRMTRGVVGKGVEGARGWFRHGSKSIHGPGINVQARAPPQT